MNTSNDENPIELTPEVLTFKGRLGRIGSVALTIKNRELRDVYFKVKSNASRFYSVRPDIGSVKPYGCGKVIINSNDDSLAKLEEIEANKHKFLIMSAVVLDKAVEPEQFWKGKKEGMDGIYTMKLKAKVHKLNSTTMSEEKIMAAPPVLGKTVPDEKIMVTPLVLGKTVPDEKSEVVPSVLGKTVPDEKSEVVPSVLGKTVPNKTEVVPSVLEKTVLDEKSEGVPPVLEKTVPDEKSEVVPSVLEKTVPDEKSEVVSSVLEKTVPDEKSEVVEKTVLDEKSEVVPATHSAVNRFYAQYTAEMVGLLLEKMSAKEAMQFRKEMNNILGKYEDKLIDG